MLINKQLPTRRLPDCDLITKLPFIVITGRLFSAALSTNSISMISFILSIPKLSSGKFDPSYIYIQCLLLLVMSVILLAETLIKILDNNTLII